MMEYYTIIMGAIFFNNFVLVRFLGICPFIGVSKYTKPAFSMGLAVTFVMLLASLFTWLIYNLVMVPLDIAYLDIVAFIFVIASLVQFVELFMKRFFKELHRLLGIYLPLITTNCAVLALTFINSFKGYDLVQSLVHGLSAGVGFTLVLLLMSGIRERLEQGNVPKPFRGVPIAFIVGALMSIAFLGLSALGK